MLTIKKKKGSRSRFKRRLPRINLLVGNVFTPGDLWPPFCVHPVKEEVSVEISQARRRRRYYYLSMLGKNTWTCVKNMWGGWSSWSMTPNKMSNFPSGSWSTELLFIVAFMSECVNGPFGHQLKNEHATELFRCFASGLPAASRFPFFVKSFRLGKRKTCFKKLVVKLIQAEIDAGGTMQYILIKWAQQCDGFICNTLKKDVIRL